MNNMYKIEAMLFASGDALLIDQISKVIDLSKEDTVKCLKSLKDDYETNERGFSLLFIEDKVQLCSNSKYFEEIRQICETPKKHELTQPLMETLAIIAYKQPITRLEIEEIRGVSASFAINKLLEYGLISEKGRLDVVGKPILFGTSDEFLKFFGIDTLEGLPELDTE